MKVSTAAVVALALLLSACALPNTTVRAGSVRPTLSIKGAPEAAVLFLDGLEVGRAAQFDGVTKVLNVEEGAHQVEIRIGNRAIHAEKFVISTGESRVVSVSAGATQ